MSYPTRTPITTAGIEAFLADAIARRGANRVARVKVRIKPDAEKTEAIVERMANDMLSFGEGMTDKDLRLAGYSDQTIAACAHRANLKARQRAGLN